MAKPEALTQAITDSESGKALRYVLVEWLNKHMAFDCLVDATPPTPTLLCQWFPLPLHFQSRELVRNRHYHLELTKVPRVYLMQELRVQWLSHLDATPPPEIFPTKVYHSIVTHSSGFYRVISEVSEDYEYLVNLHVSRL